ncbi:glycyl radical protein [Christensenella timonensis]|uniref:glycyl radical protein n=1 Tax=Christensenella timonensis TaxID=1816678 RepID=UPI000834496B|nr:glycyl radical protein [Christensenella timonensis]
MLRAVKPFKVKPRESRRIEALKKRFYEDKMYVDPQRALLVTQAYRETEGEPVIIRRAKTLSKILNNIDVVIMPYELVVGCQNGSSPRSANVFPEMATYWIEEELDEFETRPQDKFIVTDETKEALRSIFPYWKGKTLHDHIKTHMPADTYAQLNMENPAIFGWCAYQNGVGHICQDHERMIKTGFAELKKQVERQLLSLDLTQPENIEKENFLRAELIVCDAAIAFAKRYAARAREMAKQEKDEKRKKELEGIAEICEWVPEHPARTFHEAVQFVWFVELITQLETNGVSISPGSFDRYMYPYYKKDMDEGRETVDHVVDILGCFWIKLSEMVILYDKQTASFIANFSMGEHINLGGQLKNGMDATNEMSYLCLQAQMDVGLMQPNMSVRWHKNCKDEFLIEALRVVREKNAIPQIINDEIFIPSILNRGVPLEEARCYSGVGCDEISIPGKTAGLFTVPLSMAKLLELALNDGKCLITGVQMGPHSGDVSTFKSYEDILEAFRKQLEFYTAHAAVCLNSELLVHRKFMPVPFLSATVQGCIERGKDLHEGGTDYNWSSLMAMAGMANVGNSLAAIKQLVFEEKKLSLKEVMDACRVNFEGKEEVRQMLLNAPKYGNDIDYVDMITADALAMAYYEGQKYKDPRGGKLLRSIWPTYLTVTSHVQYGMHVGALPDGRLMKTSLNDSISPTQGSDYKGPTAAMNSVAKIDQTVATGGIIYNMKFSPDILKDEENLRQCAELIKAYFSKGGGQVQINVTSTQTLLDAQKAPEKHKDLMVRVTGYAALFVELSDDVQEDLITRTQFDEGLG